jgi:transcriptional regulator with XRE-family HTH domain
MNILSIFTHIIIYTVNNIGSRIKKLREEKGITQDLMAYELNISQSNYGRLEKDDRRLNIPKIEKIAEVLNISISVLFKEKAHINHENNDLAQNHIIIQRDKEHIASLKEEIIFLRKFLDNIVA